MTRQSNRWVVLLVGLFVFVLTGCSMRPTARTIPNDICCPNIVIIMVDDMGWADLACYGNKTVDTPALDRFTREGMLFTDACATSNRQPRVRRKCLVCRCVSR